MASYPKNTSNVTNVEVNMTKIHPVNETSVQCDIEEGQIGLVPKEELKRNMSARHINMIAIAGLIVN